MHRLRARLSESNESADESREDLLEAACGSTLAYPTGEVLDVVIVSLVTPDAQSPICLTARGVVII